MPAKNHPVNPITADPGSRCHHLDEMCILFDLSDSLGANIRDTLLGFVSDSEEGSRLTLQRNRNGFTVQVTGPVQRTSKGMSALAQLRELTDNLPAARGTGSGSGTTGD